jgi:hypothetical protein
MSDVLIEIAGGERVDELRELWLALHHHHQSVATLQPLVSRRRRDVLAPAPGALRRVALNGSRFSRDRH